MTGLAAPPDLITLPRNVVSFNPYDIKRLPQYETYFKGEYDEEFLPGEEVEVYGTLNGVTGRFTLRRCLAQAAIPCDATLHEASCFLEAHTPLATGVKLAKKPSADLDDMVLEVAGLMLDQYTENGQVLADIPINTVFWVIVRGYAQVKSHGALAAGLAINGIQTTGKAQEATAGERVLGFMKEAAGGANELKIAYVDVNGMHLT